MGATVVDALVVTLGLDPAPFQKGQRVADDAMKKTKDAAVKNAKAIEEANKNTLSYVSKLTTGFLGLFAVLAGGRGFKDLIEDVNAANAALGRFSANLGQAPQAVGALQAVTERMGGTAQDANQALENANRTIQDFLVKGKGIPEVISRMTAQVGGKVDFNHGPLAYLKSLAPIFQRMQQVDPARAHAFMQELGIPDSVANAMAQYGDGFGKVIDGLQRLQASSGAIKAAQDLQTAWATVNQEIAKTGSDIAEKIDPAMTRLLDDISAGIEKIRLDPEVAKNWSALSASFDKLLSDINAKPSEGGFIAFIDDQIKRTISDIDELIKTIDKLYHFVAPSKDEVIQDMQKAQDAGPFDPLKWLKGHERDTSGDTPNVLTPEDRARLGGGRGIDRDGSGGKSIDLQRADDEIFPRNRGAGFGAPAQAQPIKVGSAEISASNPLPVRIIQQGGAGSIWDLLSGGGSGGGGSGSGYTPPAGRHGKGAPRSTEVGSGGDYGGGSSAGNLTKLIDEAAKAEGIDPRIMEGIRAGESGHGSRYDKKDDALESSWGPFQLNRRRGLGVEFEKDTGLDVRDPRTIPAQAKWVARYIKRHGGPNGQWMGYHGPRNADPKWGDSGYVPQLPDVAMGAAASAALNNITNDHKVTTTSSSNEMHIGAININGVNPNSSSEVAGSISPALAKNVFASYANQGPM